MRPRRRRSWRWRAPAGRFRVRRVARDAHLADIDESDGRRAGADARGGARQAAGARPQPGAARARRARHQQVVAVRAAGFGTCTLRECHAAPVSPPIAFAIASLLVRCSAQTSSYPRVVQLNPSFTFSLQSRARTQFRITVCARSVSIESFDKASSMFRPSIPNWHFSGAIANELSYS